MNIALLEGTLSSEPRERTLESGSLLMSWEVTTEIDGSRASVPVVWFDPPGSVRGFAAGERVVVLGCVRRRFFRARGATMSATEVVASEGARLRRTKQVQRIRAAAAARVDDLGEGADQAA